MEPHDSGNLGFSYGFPLVFLCYPHLKRLRRGRGSRGTPLDPFGSAKAADSEQLFFGMDGKVTRWWSKSRENDLEIITGWWFGTLFFPIDWVANHAH